MPVWLRRKSYGLLLLVTVPLLLLLYPRQDEFNDFEQARLKVEASDDWCFGRGEYHRLKTELGESSLRPDIRLKKLERLATIQLRLGFNEEALKSLTEALTLSTKDADSASLQGPLHAALALTWLRLGEVRNCALDGGSQACIFPLQGSGIHSDSRAARMAKTELELALGKQLSEEERVRCRWLLNITAMQLGEYPESVPAHLRLAGLPEENQTPRFRNVAPALGMRASDLCGGVVVEDMNNDGYLDIVSSGSGFQDPVRLWLNLGNGQFEDKTQSSGLSDQVAAFNVRSGDYDNDGDQDLLLLRGAYLEDLGEIRNSLMRNEGDGTFTDVTEAAGLANPARPTGTAVWGDFNNDGFLDIFVGNESRPPYEENRYPCQLFQNNGDGTFSDVAKSAGVDAVLYAKGVAAGDLDNDGDLDLVVSNFGHWKLSEEERGRDLLFQNQGDGTFKEIGKQYGLEGGGRAFGCWFFDYDNDGWLDLFIARYEAGSLGREVSRFMDGVSSPGQTRLFRNLEGQGFQEMSRETGLTGTYSTMGCSFGDLNTDGFLDLYLGTGALFYHYLVPNITLLNREGVFEDVTLQTGLSHLQKGHGIAFADFDHDGDQDIYAQMGGNFEGDPFPNALFENPGNEHNFLYLDLKAKQVVGTRVRVTIRDKDKIRSMHRAVGAVSSFGHTPLRQEIGLGAATEIEELKIVWPSGQAQTWRDCPLNVLLEIREGESQPSVIELVPVSFPETPDSNQEWCLPEISNRKQTTPP